MGRVVHFEIQADDLDRAKRFYTTVFGWTVMPGSASSDYRLLITGPDGEPGINGAITTRSGPPAGESIAAWVCTVEVTDMAQTERAVVAGGGRQVRDRGEVPGVGVVSYFTDTEGNTFAAIQPEPETG